ncbi:hypothetical protein WA026_019415 [Henosepilachna vigintioctopunctata]|uniref:Uncharacterized protein n=1 Tax=Henosepilachna vigintioctopunctata TaxID=420089 RepID=A0AAW1U5F8_9CUCU
MVIFMNEETDEEIRSRNIEEVTNIIKGSGKRKAPGPDGIPSIAVTELPPNAKKKLENIINGALKLKHIPKKWKEADAIAIPSLEKREISRQVELLLLGAGESGKSRFLKQMRIIHGIKFDDYVKEYRKVIYQNVAKEMQVLVDARDKLDIPWGDPSNASAGKELLQFNNVMHLDTRLFLHYTPVLSKLWSERL